MKRFLLLALLAASFVLLAPHQEAQAWGRGYGRGRCYYPYYPLLYPYPRDQAPALEVNASSSWGLTPSRASVRPGTTVRWINRGARPLTIKSENGLFDSGPIAPGAAFSATFHQPGAYRYVSRPEGKQGVMGTIIVVGPSAPGRVGD